MKLSRLAFHSSFLAISCDHQLYYFPHAYNIHTWFFFLVLWKSTLAVLCFYNCDNLLLVLHIRKPFLFNMMQCDLQGYSCHLKKKRTWLILGRYIPVLMLQVKKPNRRVKRFGFYECIQDYVLARFQQSPDINLRETMRRFQERYKYGFCEFAVWLKSISWSVYLFVYLYTWNVPRRDEEEYIRVQREIFTSDVSQC
jgi:hypothetical protein